MQQLYFELRNLPDNPPATLAADIARHLQMRQYLGTAVIICDNSHSILSATRKQWLKGARYLQRLRASTLNAEEILRLTHAIMHMQNMHFVAKSPLDSPDASVFFMTPDQPIPLPLSCYTIYMTAPVPAATFKKLAKQLPQDSLIVNYSPDKPAEMADMQPKDALEQHLLAKWDYLTTFLKQHGIDPARLVVGNTLQFGAMDEALDILLNISTDFLRESANFQRSINLAQPLSTITNSQQKMFEAVTRLAHRVQALTPGNFNNYLVTNFGDSGSETFFLRDVGSELYTDLEIEAAAAGGPAM